MLFLEFVAVSYFITDYDLSIFIVISFLNFERTFDILIFFQFSKCMYLSYICVQLLCSGNNDAAVEVVFDQIETISMIGGESSSGMNEDEDDEEEEEEDEENQGVTTTVVVSEGLQMISKVMKEGKDGDGGGGER